jgi:hypothetical protein
VTSPLRGARSVRAARQPGPCGLVHLLLANLVPDDQQLARRRRPGAVNRQVRPLNGSRLLSPRGTDLRAGEASHEPLVALPGVLHANAWRTRARRADARSPRKQAPEARSPREVIEGAPLKVSRRAVRGERRLAPAVGLEPTTRRLTVVFCASIDVISCLPLYLFSAMIGACRIVAG